MQRVGARMFHFLTRYLGTTVFFVGFCWGVCLLVFTIGWLPIVPRSFANQCKNSSHTRESMTDKASCSIGYGASRDCSRTSM